MLTSPSARPLPHPKLPTPPPLMMSEPGSFAHLTYTRRWQDIIRRVVNENSFPIEIVAALETLCHELFDSTIRQLKDKPAPDIAAWNNYLDPFIGKPWVEVPWFFAEVYFYRRLLEATQYFQLGKWQNVDPFWQQKHSSLETAISDIRLMSCQWLTHDSAPIQANQWQSQFAQLFYSVLWGNRADLSLNPTATAIDVQSGISTQSEAAKILVDDTAIVEKLLSQRSLERIDLIADNAGFELACDLFLIDFLLTSQITQKVYLHLKAHPTFVSDATIPDLHSIIHRLESDEDAHTQAFAQKLDSYLQKGLLCVEADPFWAFPLVFWEMPASTQRSLAQSQLTIIKGDANYRRLLGDCRWAFNASFQDIVSYFPTELVALRTLKSEVVAGLSLDQIQALNQQDPHWLTDGRWGVIQVGDRSGSTFPSENSSAPSIST